MKECFKCGVSQPLTDFYKHPQMADGHLNKCKTCNKKDVIANRLDKLEYYREYDRVRGNRQTAEYQIEYRKNKPIAYKAQYLLTNAIRDGRLIRGDKCVSCKTTDNIVGHHHDYLKPLDVEWLCQACHVQWHHANGEGLNAR